MNTQDKNLPPEGSGSPNASSNLRATYSAVADHIIRRATADDRAWQRIASWTDRYPHRLSGSEVLERAIDWALQELSRDGLQHVHGEPVMVPHWVRGQESATLLSPREVELHMLGLGGSVGTPPEGITAPVLVVSSFDELTARAEEAHGKMVLFNAPFVQYRETVAYRSRGAVAAAKVGAVAVLVRSIASGSMQNPHTGNMAYDPAVPPIPAAALSVEDAGLLARWASRGETVMVRLKMQAETLPDAWSRNIVAEIPGGDLAHEVLVLGGHIDCWDVGQGAMDDAGGFVAAWEALNVIQAWGKPPRRTIRLVGWTNEENGLRGGTGYRDAHRAELDRHVLAMESDASFFPPIHFTFGGQESSLPLLQDLAALLAPLGPFSVDMGGPAADVGPLYREGVPTLSLHSDSHRYMFYHHSAADTPDKLDPKDVAHAVAAMALYAYVLADMPGRVAGPTA